MKQVEVSVLIPPGLVHFTSEARVNTPRTHPTYDVHRVAIAEQLTPSVVVVALSHGNTKHRRT